MRYTENVPLYKQDNTPPASLPWMEFAIGFTFAMYALETYLDIRQYRKLCTTTPPVALLKAVKKIKNGGSFEKTINEKFESSQAYGRDKAKFGMLKRFFDEIVGVTMILIGFGTSIAR